MRVDTIVPGTQSRPSGSHDFDATALIELARTVFGAVPPVKVVSVGAAQFGFGDGLSGEVTLTMPIVTDVVVGLIEGEALPRLRSL